MTVVSAFERVDRREEPLFADLPRNLVVLGLIAERPRHAATTGPALAAEQPAARIAIDGPMPINAFWWQCPWKRTSSAFRSRAS